MNILSLQFLLSILFLTIVFLHLARKNFTAIIAYGVQSLMIFLFLFDSFLETGSVYLLVVVALTLVVKVILAPIFFTQLVRKHALTFTVTTYFNVPLTLIVIALLTLLASSHKLAPLTKIVPDHQHLLSLALSALFLSLFLIINRRGALSQILGILSIENSILAFVIFAGLEQSPILQIGIIFNIFIWIIIATVFISMLYKHFRTLDVTLMKNLKD